METENKRSPIWRWIAGCLIVMACLCGAATTGVGAWFWKLYTAYPTDPVALTQIVQKEVTQMRGLEFKQPVTPKLLTPEQLRDHIQKQFEEELPPEKLRGFELTLTAFDLLEPGTDLRQLYLDLLSEQVAGLYDPETQELYVVSNASSVSVVGRMTLAHELTHALQDQYYDLQKLGYGKKSEHDSEYMAGLQGLVEGDASLLQTQYMQKKFSPLDWLRFGLEYSQIDMTRYNKAPKFISAGLTFPYIQGSNFAKSLYTAGGWPAVNAAFADPPQSTEQILHPGRYRTGDKPRIVTLPPLTDTLGSGWRMVDSDIMGEFSIQVHLEPRLKTITSTLAAQGWGGDQYATFYNDTQQTTLLAWRTVWDNEAEASEFVSDYMLYLTDVFGHAADSTQGNRVCWQRSQDHRCMTWQAASVVIVRGPDAGTVEQVLDKIKP